MTSTIVDQLCEAGGINVCRGSEADLQIAMRNDEVCLFESFLRQSKRYFEFGCGGSTALACKLVSEEVVSVDSSQEWLDKVRENCSDLPILPELKFIDIGPIGAWGNPINGSKKDQWPAYSGAVFSGSDFYFVDGRFRVASFLRSLIVSEYGSLIAFHDFESRKYYHPVRMVCREIAKATDLSIFIKDNEANMAEAQRLYDSFKWDPR